MFRPLWDRVRGRRAVKTCPARVRCKLSLELLEGREVPANISWIGGHSNNSYWDVNNWDLIRLPRKYDHVYFSGSNDCEGFGPSPWWDMMTPTDGSYAGITLTAGYTGHVKLTGQVPVYALDLFGGAIDQPVINTEIEVRTSFNWTGGTLNSTTNASTLSLMPGSSGSIVPGVGNTITTGSTLRLVGDQIGSTATFGAGTVEFVRGGGVKVGYLCQAKVVVAPNANVSHTNTTNNPTVGYVVDPGGEFVVTGSGGAVFNSQLPITNFGIIKVHGTVNQAGSRAMFTRHVGGVAEMPSVLLYAGRIIIEDGCELGAAEGMKALTGSIETWFPEGIAINAPAALITTPKLVNQGADIVIYSNKTNRLWADAPNNPSLHFGILQVAGEVLWSGGSFKCGVHQGVNQNPSDKWTSSGKFTIDMGQPGEPPLIEPTMVSATGAMGGAATVNNVLWEIIESGTALVLLPSGYPSDDEWWCEATMLVTEPNKLYLRSTV